MIEVDSQREPFTERRKAKEASLPTGATHLRRILTARIDMAARIPLRIRLQIPNR